MLRRIGMVRVARTALAAFGLFVWAGTPAHAGKWFRRQPPAPVAAPVAVPTALVAPAVPVAEPPPLGTFQPTPFIMVRGNFPTGGGFSPLGYYGDTTMSLYGPLSSLRAITAPVAVYTRGYDGSSAIVEGTATSYPNLPPLSPVVYPTQATNAFGFRHTTTPPWWNNGNMWVDHN